MLLSTVIMFLKSILEDTLVALFLMLQMKLFCKNPQQVDGRRDGLLIHKSVHQSNRFHKLWRLLAWRQGEEAAQSLSWMQIPEVLQERFQEGIFILENKMGIYKEVQISYCIL